MQKFAAWLFALSCVMGSMAQAEMNMGIPLLEKETSGGHVPPDYYGWGEKLSVYTNGKVILSKRANYDSPWTHELLAVIADNVIDKITESVASLEQGELVFPEDEPECTDVPTTTYLAKNAAGHQISFAEQRACRLGVLENFYAAYNLEQILNGLHALSWAG